MLFNYEKLVGFLHRRGLTFLAKMTLYLAPDEGIVKSIYRVILSRGKYVTRREIMDELRLSGWDLTGISTKQLNNNLGFFKPTNKFEADVKEQLEVYLHNIESQKTFPECRSEKGYLLRFDFYIPSLRIAIECDGEQHHDPNHYYFNEAVFRNDQIKTRFCSENGIRLVRIGYKDFLNAKRDIWGLLPPLVNHLIKRYD